MKLVYHHTGIAVDRIDDVADNYRLLFGPDCISQKYHISSQQVNVCFVDMGNQTYLELVEATAEDSGIQRMRKKGYTYYHTAFLTEDIENTVRQLEGLHYRPMEYFSSEAFDGKRCIFLYSPDAHLIELIEH